MTSFEELGISTSVMKALKEIGIESPFPIQESSIPFILKGMDVIGQAHTGTGKTAAFSLPLITRMKPKSTYSGINIGTNKGIGYSSDQ